jgi:hypothetical protein
MVTIPSHGWFIIWLVVWNMNFIFPFSWDFITPTDELIFFRGVGIPPTSYCFTHITLISGYQRLKLVRSPAKEFLIFCKVSFLLAMGNGEMFSLS